MKNFGDAINELKMSVAHQATTWDPINVILRRVASPAGIRRALSDHMSTDQHVAADQFVQIAKISPAMALDMLTIVSSPLDKGYTQKVMGVVRAGLDRTHIEALTKLVKNNQPDAHILLRELAQLDAFTEKSPELKQWSPQVKM